MEKAPDAFRTISEVSDWLDTPTHVLRFWESRFPEVAPVKRAGGRRYYRVEDVRLLGGIKKLLHEDGVTIKALQDRIKSDGAESVAALSPPLDSLAHGDAGAPQDTAAPVDEKPPADEAASATGSTPRVTPAKARQTSASPAGETPTVPPSATGKRAPLGGRQRSLSFADKPASDGEASQSASFQRHPVRIHRNNAPKPEPAKGSARAHPSRPGLFLYDDSDSNNADAADATTRDTTSTLAPIDHVPADIDDDCRAPNAVPATAELRAMTALVAAPLPADATEIVSRLHALRDRWA